MPLFLSTADTDLLAARAAQGLLPDDFGTAADRQPGRGCRAAEIGELLHGLSAPDFVLVRLLGGRGAWPDGLDALRAACAERQLPLVALGGEATLDAELTALSTVASGVVTESAGYLAEGGPANVASLLRFLSDTLLLTGHGFDPPVADPAVRRATASRGRAAAAGRRWASSSTGRTS